MLRDDYNRTLILGGLFTAQSEIRLSLDYGFMDVDGVTDALRAIQKLIDALEPTITFDDEDE